MALETVMDGYSFPYDDVLTLVGRGVKIRLYSSDTPAMDNDQINLELEYLLENSENNIKM